MVDVKVIKKIDKKDYPEWLYEDSERQAYEITINGKKTYAYWANPRNNMLYVDGFNKDLNPNVRGWDVRSALTSYLEYESLFEDSMPNVDEAIDKAIKDWEFKSKLNSNTIKTFSEIIDEL